MSEHETTHITESCGNVFLDLGFSEEESTILKMRADVMIQLEKIIIERGWTQGEAAKVMRVSQARVSDLVRGKWDKFSLDMLLTLAARAGLHPRIELAA